MLQVGGLAPLRLGQASGLGEIKAALIVDAYVYLVRNQSMSEIRDQSIERVRLSDGKSDILLHFNQEAYGKLYLTQDRSRIMYAVSVNDQGAEFSWAFRAGFIDLASGLVSPFLFSLQNIYSLGLSGDAQTFYGMPVGDDSDFGPLWIMSTRNGVVIKEMPVNASSSAALSPDRRYIVTRFLWVKDKNGQDAENMIRLYDLSRPTIAPVDFRISPLPRTVSNFLWSPDSRRVYFQPMDIHNTQSYGLWQMDVPTGAVEQVAPLDDLNLIQAGISPDSKWMAMHYLINAGLMLDLTTGQAYAFHLPGNAWLAGWR
jgi:dipeptidyl aminopeptidase/acylaminoacyl peptidase